MQNARTVKKFSAGLAFALCLAAALVLPNEVWAAAGGVQNCTTGSTCTIGEFLYDDLSAPIAGAACTITSKYPDHSNYIFPAAAMSGGGADGWYYHEFTAPATLGMYSTQVSCTVSGDTLSIDKSFEVTAGSSSDPNAVATAVWGYSGKTLDSFGSLPADIWSYSTRTVSSFGSLIADIWASATRTLTGAGLSSGQLATQDDVVSVRNSVNNLSTSTGDLTAIKNKVDENRLLLERVVNKPIIENVLEDTSTPDLSSKIKETRVIANQLYVNNQFLTAQTATLTSKWNLMEGSEALDFVISLSDVVGEAGDPSSANTMFGQANYLKDSWNWDEAQNLNTKLTAIQKNLVSLKESLADYQKTPAMVTSAKLLVKDSLALEKMVGTASDKSSSKTLFAKIKSTESLAASLDDKGTQVQKVLGEYVKNKDEKAVLPKLAALQSQIIALNKVPSISLAIAKVKGGDEKSIKNSFLALLGVVNSNKKLLALGAGKTLVNTWLEMGSIVFKTLATNPSTLISQEVEIKYYLPAEIKQEDIIKSDAGLEIKYDAEKGQVYAQGKFTLAPGATRTFSIETKDIWLFSESELDSLRKQADELYRPLEKTAYYAQGVTLKTDIDANLDRMAQTQGAAVTPEDKIRAYREASILKTSVDEKMAGLRDLVTQASAAGNLFGFVGGAQTIAVWGLIIIIAAGFIFMTIYMRTVTAKAKAENEEPSKAKGKVEKKQVHQTGIRPAALISIILVSSVLSAAVSGLVVSKVASKNYEEKLTVLGTQTQKEESISEPEVQLNDASSVESGDEALGVGGPYLVVIAETATPFLRVRSTPGGEEVGKVYPGDKLPFISENDGWYQVSLESGEEGWVSKEYSTKE